MPIDIGNFGEDIARRIRYMEYHSKRENPLVLSAGFGGVALHVEVDRSDTADGEVLAADTNSRLEGGVGSKPFAVFGYARVRGEKG